MAAPLSLVHVETIQGATINLVINVNLESPKEIPDYPDEYITVCNNVNAIDFRAKVKATVNPPYNESSLGTNAARSVAANGVLAQAKEGALNFADQMVAKKREKTHCSSSNCKIMIWISIPENPVVDGPHDDYSAWFGYDEVWAFAVVTVHLYYGCTTLEKLKEFTATIEEMERAREEKAKELNGHTSKIKGLHIVPIGVSKYRSIDVAKLSGAYLGKIETSSVGAEGT